MYNYELNWATTFDWQARRRDWSMKINTNRKAMNTSSSSPSTSCCHWTWKSVCWNEWFVWCIVRARGEIRRRKKWDAQLRRTNEVVLKQFALRLYVDDNLAKQGGLLLIYTQSNYQIHSNKNGNVNSIPPKWKKRESRTLWATKYQQHIFSHNFI